MLNIFLFSDNQFNCRYFKPNPRCVIDKETGTCTLQLPKSSPLQRIISVQGNRKILKQLACLEACEELHRVGALTDNLVPDIVEEETINKELGNSNIFYRMWVFWIVMLHF